MMNWPVFFAFFVSTAIYGGSVLAQQKPYVPFSQFIFDVKPVDPEIGFQAPSMIRAQDLQIPEIESGGDSFIRNFPVQQVIDNRGLLGMACDSEESTVSTFVMNPNRVLAMSLGIAEKNKTENGFPTGTDFVMFFKSKGVDMLSDKGQSGGVATDSGWPLNNTGVLTIQDLQKLHLENRFSHMTKDDCLELYKTATRRFLKGEENQQKRFCDISKTAPYLFSNVYRAHEFKKLGSRFAVEFNRGKDCRFDGLGSINCTRISQTPFKLGDLDVYGVMVFASQETRRTPKSTSGRYWVDLQFKVKTGRNGFHWFNMNFSYDTYVKQRGEEPVPVRHCDFRQTL